MSMIDNGNKFDFGQTAADYAKYRDIYPKEFYDKIYDLGYYHKSQRVLDIGTGSGVLPRNMYKYGSDITAADISENQIKYAKELSAADDLQIKYIVGSDSSLDFDNASFGCITACQCWFYLNHEVFAPKAYNWLKDNGKLGIFYMGYLPKEDKIAGMSEDLIKKYNPDWNGYGDYRRKIQLPGIYYNYFDIEYNDFFDVKIPFTRESWNGRIKSCRGIGAELSEDKISLFETEHKKILHENAEEQFTILHYCALLSLKKKI